MRGTSRAVWQFNQPARECTAPRGLPRRPRHHGNCANRCRLQAVVRTPFRGRAQPAATQAMRLRNPPGRTRFRSRDPQGSAADRLRLPVLLGPPPFVGRVCRRWEESVDRPELHQRLVDVDLPVESAVLQERCQPLVDRIYPLPTSIRATPALRRPRPNMASAGKQSRTRRGDPRLRAALVAVGRRAQLRLDGALPPARRRRRAVAPDAGRPALPRLRLPCLPYALSACLCALKSLTRSSTTVTVTRKEP